VREQFLDEIGAGDPPLADIPFNLDSVVLNSELAFRTIVLDNGFNVTGPLEGFQDPIHFTQSNIDDGKVEVRVRGQIIDQKLKTRS
jgi:hypothetical protein